MSKRGITACLVVVAFLSVVAMALFRLNQEQIADNAKTYMAQAEQQIQFAAENHECRTVRECYYKDRVVKNDIDMGYFHYRRLWRGGAAIPDIAPEITKFLCESDPQYCS